MYVCATFGYLIDLGGVDRGIDREVMADFCCHVAEWVR